MLNKQEQIEKIKRQLAPMEADDLILSDLFDDWYSAALAKSNRKDGDRAPALLAIVRNCVIAAYNRRGNEGMTGSGSGGQSESYEDLHDNMMKAILQEGLRVFKP